MTIEKVWVGSEYRDLTGRKIKTNSTSEFVYVDHPDDDTLYTPSSKRGTNLTPPKKKRKRKGR